MRRILFALALALPAGTASGETVLLRGATVHTVSGADIANGSVLIQDGKIAAVGASVAAPPDARVVD
ncbi:MAG: amidohydrolase family protein, partial [Thermoanaerobaculia bacterium]